MSSTGHRTVPGISEQVCSSTRVTRGAGAAGQPYRMLARLFGSLVA